MIGQTTLEIKKQISKGKTALAIENLKKISSGKFKSEIALLSSRFHTMQEKFGKATITKEEYTVECNRINKATLDLVEQMESTTFQGDPDKSPGFNSWRVKYLFRASIILCGISLMLIVSGNQQSFENEKVIILLKFDGNKSAKFSREVGDRLPLDYIEPYALESLPSVQLSPHIPGYREIINKKYFERQSRMGLLINGVWDTSMDRIFNARIDIFNLNLQDSNLKTDEEVTILSPKSVDFNIKSSAQFLSEFIIAIVDMYEGRVNVALKTFESFFNNKALMKGQDKNLEPFLEISIANCYLLAGETSRAINAYEKLLNTPGPYPESYRRIITNNLITAESFSSPTIETKVSSGPTLKQPGIQNHHTILAPKPIPSNFPETNQPKQQHPVEEKAKLYPTFIKQKITVDSTGHNPIGISPDSSLFYTPTEPSEKQDQENSRNFLEDYKIIHLSDSIIWIAENLNIHLEKSWCLLNKSDNCEKYGSLYTLESAKMACKALGNNWRLPTLEEWQKLINSEEIVEISTRKDRVNIPDNLKKLSGLGIPPDGGGWRQPNGIFIDSENTVYWTSTNADTTKSHPTHHRTYTFWEDGKIGKSSGGKDNAHYVRCVCEK